VDAVEKHLAVSTPRLSKKVTPKLPYKAEYTFLKTIDITDCYASLYLLSEVNIIGLSNERLTGQNIKATTTPKVY